MSERDEKVLKDRIVWMQALPDEAAERFLSAEGALHQGASRQGALNGASVSERIGRLYVSGGADERPYNSKAEYRR